ncbi:MAG: CPBP family intramembrane glutamic endopeptidase [Halohasta sp.]
MSELLNTSSGDGGESPREKLLTAGVATGLGFGAIGLTFAILLPIIFVVRQFGLPLPTAPLALTAFELIVGQVFVMGGLSVVYLLYTGRGLEYVPIRRPTLVETLVIVAAPFGIILVSAVVAQLSMLFGVEPSEHALTGMGDIDPQFYLYMIPLVIFIVGPFEELLYRGVVQTRLRESFGPAAAILLASLIFAAIHLPAHGFGQAGLASTGASMAALVGGSIVFGAIYEWSKNLTVVALIHGLYNSILLALLYVVTVYGPEIEELAETSEPALALLGL